MAVLVFSSTYDPSTDDVLARLTHKGVPWLRLNMNDFAATGSCSLDTSNRLTFCSYGDVLEAEEVSAIWFRRYSRDVDMSHGLNPAETFFVRRELDHFWRSVFARLESRTWINPHTATSLTKPEQIRIARAAGFRVPNTIVSNSPAHVREFLELNNDQCIVKPISHGFVIDYLRCQIGPKAALTNAELTNVASHDVKTNIEPKICFTELIKSEEVNDASIIACPAIYQERIYKSAELRITIVGSQIFPVVIHTQTGLDPDSATAVDWRRNITITDRAHEAVKLPDNINEKLLSVMNDLGLVFACIDAIVTPEGEYVFLEANPCGQWGWVEHLTKLPITDAVTSFLAKASLKQL